MIDYSCLYKVYVRKPNFNSKLKIFIIFILTLTIKIIIKSNINFIETENTSFLYRQLNINLFQF